MTLKYLIEVLHDIWNLKCHSVQQSYIVGFISCVVFPVSSQSTTAQ